MRLSLERGDAAMPSQESLEETEERREAERLEVRKVCTSLRMFMIEGLARVLLLLSRRFCRHHETRIRIAILG